jgi:hypothetical protein
MDLQLMSKWSDGHPVPETEAYKGAVERMTAWIESGEIADDPSEGSCKEIAEQQQDRNSK